MKHFKLKLLFLSLTFYASHLFPTQKQFDLNKIFYASTDTINRRQYMEDAHISKKIYKPFPFLYLAVFDGHSIKDGKGLAVANYLKNNLLNNILSEYKEENFNLKAFKESILKGFEKTNNEINEKLDTYITGSTALAVFIINKMLIIANVGDSRAIISENEQAIQLSNDHSTSNKDEYERIKKEGAQITPGNPPRILGLNITRVFGHKNSNAKHKKILEPTPDIKEYKLSKRNSFLVLGSDGLWYFLSNSKIIKTTRILAQKEYHSIQEIAKALTDQCSASGNGDNITTIIVDLRRYLKNE